MRFRYLPPILIIAVLLISASVAASGLTPFEAILGDFAQTRCGICVTYAHTMAIAQSDPAGFLNLIEKRPRGWAVNLAGRKQYVPQAEMEKSIKNEWSHGEPDNLINVFAMAVSMRNGGYYPLTGMLDYGRSNYCQFIGTGKWTLYDPEQGPGRSLPEGLNRLAREAQPDGTPGTAATMGFGELDEKRIGKELAEEVSRIGFYGGHDYTVARYDAEAKAVVLRNPASPKKPFAVPVELLKKIPCGIDFMEPIDK